MKRAFLLIATVAATSGSALFLACSGGGDVKIDAAMETGPADTGVDCGPTNVGTLHCREGASGKACSSMDIAPVKIDPSMFCSMYMCKPGQVELVKCACNAEFAKVDAGADCPD